jgi:protoporphyrin/coproporphyrin ferrochelatase
MSPADSKNCFGCKKYYDKIGVLWAQLGTPEAPTKEALRPYLKRFLGDPRIIEKPRWLWWLILNGIILNVRPKRSAALYKRIWREDGTSPLEYFTKQQTNLLRKNLEHLSSEIEVEYGMRYSEPTLENAVDKLIEKGCTKILLFNAYPQYSATTSASNYDAVFKHLLTKRVVPTLRVVAPYYRHTSYIDSLAETINNSLSKLANKPERLVFSYHGIPEEYVENGDIYCCHCTETSRALIPKLNFPKEKIIHTYQSRFGKDPWLVPYTDETIKKLAEEGIKHIAVCAPGFVADCLETLDELGNEGTHLFKEHGGEKLTLIPCLNDQPAWIKAMTEIATEEIQTWLDQNKQLTTPYEKFPCPVKVEKAKGAKKSNS